jgi:hypothetical protein
MSMTKRAVAVAGYHRISAAGIFLFMGCCLIAALGGCGGDGSGGESDADMGDISSRELGTVDTPQREDQTGSDVAGDLVEDEASGFPPDVPQDLAPDVEPLESGFQRVGLGPVAKLRAIWGDGEVFFAAGEGGSIHRRQGSFWTPMLVPTGKDLFAIFGESPSKVWAAGADGTVLHFDGVAWSAVGHGIPDLSGISLRGIWGEEGHLYVVGDKGTVLHKVGANWTREPSLTSYNLHSIWGSSLIDIYVGAAVGTILHRMGSTWVSETAMSGTVQMMAVHGLDDGLVYAVGTGAGIARRASGGWLTQFSNDPYTRNLHALWCFSPEEIWLLGKDGALVTRVADKWMTREIKGPYYRNHTFWGVWGWKDVAGSKAMAVGDGGSALSFDGTEWRDERTGLTVDIQDMAGDTASTGMAVGTDGLVLRYDHGQWYGLNRITSRALNAVVPLGTGFLAVGEDGAVVHVEGDEVQPGSDASENTLLGLCTNGKYLAAVGEYGTLLTSTDGEFWSVHPTGVFDHLRSCVMDSMGRATIVGDSGRVLRLDGTTVSTVPMATLSNLHRVIAGGPGGTLAILGDNGLVLTGKNDEYSRVYEAPGTFLYAGAWFGSRLVVAGWAGVVVQIEGQKIEETQIPGVGAFRALWGESRDLWYLLGTQGAIVRHEGP